MKTSFPPFDFSLPRRRIAYAVAALLVSTTAAVQGKPSAMGVVVNYRLSGTATVGQPYSVIVDFTKVVAPGTKVSFTASRGMVLGNAQARTLPASDTSITLQVTPSANGLQFVNVFTRQGTGGSATSIPVQVGPETPQEEKPGHEVIGPGGRALHLLPIE